MEVATKGHWDSGGGVPGGTWDTLLPWMERSWGGQSGLPTEQTPVNSNSSGNMTPVSP